MIERTHIRDGPEDYQVAAGKTAKRPNGIFNLIFVFV